MGEVQSCPELGVLAGPPVCLRQMALQEELGYCALQSNNILICSPEIFQCSERNITQLFQPHIFFSPVVFHCRRSSCDVGCVHTTVLYPRCAQTPGQTPGRGIFFKAMRLHGKASIHSFKQFCQCLAFLCYYRIVQLLL